MKKDETTIEEGSCSRIARPQKALDRRAQSRPSSTVSRWVKVERRIWADAAMRMVEDFRHGHSMAQVAKRHGLTVESVEYFIRKAMNCWRRKRP